MIGYLYNMSALDGSKLILCNYKHRSFIKICISCLSLSFAFQGIFVSDNVEITWNGTLEGHGLGIPVTEQNKFSSEYSVISHTWKHKIIYRTIILLVFLSPLLYGYES